MVSSINCDSLLLASVRRTTWTAVSQFEGRTVDNRPVYVRLRHGELTVRVGNPGDDNASALDQAPVFDGDYGDHHEFDITWSEVERVTGLRCIGLVEDHYQ